jgi:hypothetical protein
VESSAGSRKEELDREHRLHLRARELGYVLRKSRNDGAVYRAGAYVGENPRDRGRWMIVDAATDMAITGIRYELTLEDIEAFLDVRT